MLQSHPNRTLHQHLHEVEVAAMAILDRHRADAFKSMNIDVRQVMHFLAGWHDIAKATVYFQQYICDTEGWQKKVAKNEASNEHKTHTPLGALLRNQSPLSALGVFALQPDEATLRVYLIPRQVDNFTPSHSRRICNQIDRAQVFSGVSL